MGMHLKCATIDHPGSYLHILFSTCYYRICSRSERGFRGTERDQSFFVSLTPLLDQELRSIMTVGSAGVPS